MKNAQGKQTARWVGPGAVLLTQGTSAFVLMGKRLWKCSKAQLCSAAREEAKGADILIADGRYRHLLSERSALPPWPASP